MDLANYRENYSRSFLDESQLPESPSILFESWFKEVLESGKEDPTAMALATADEHAKPSVRMVLLKGLDSRGYIFYTNYESRKSLELIKNPQAALLFFWNEFQRQVRIEGHVLKLSDAESDEYFFQRPAESRISAMISPQSQGIPDRNWLENRVDAYQRQNPGGPDQRPDFWGGYLLVPDRYEFWQGRENRLHDRIQFIRSGEAWKINRLAP